MLDLIINNINIIALIATLFGVVYAIRVKRRVRLVADFYTKNLITNSELDVLIDEKAYNRLSLTTIVIRNEGNCPIYQKMMLDSCIRITSNASDASIIKFSTTNSEGNFKVFIANDSSGLSITVDRMFPNDSLTIIIYHSGLSNNSLLISGSLEGQKRLKRRDYVTLLSPSTLPISINDFMQSFYWAICISFIFVVFDLLPKIIGQLHTIKISPFIVTILIFILTLFVALFTSAIHKWLRFNHNNN